WRPHRPPARIRRRRARRAPGDAPSAIPAGLHQQGLHRARCDAAVDAGKLDLDRTARSYLPWFTTAERDVSGTITLRQLLNHTSGLSTATGNVDNLNDDVTAGALERGVRRLATQSLVSRPGSEFHYP